MSNFIVPLSSLPTVSSIADKKQGSGVEALGKGSSFAQVLSNVMGSVEETRQNSSDTMYDLAIGGNDDLHTGAISALKYNTAVSFASGVTNSVIRAYNELMRMQI